MSPTARTLAYLRKQGWTAGVVEKWNQYARVRQDLFGCIDIVCVDGCEIMGVQATTTSNQANRLTKSLAEPRLRAWLEAGGRFAVVGWKKSKKTNRWEMTWREVSLAELPGAKDAFHV